MGEPAFVISSVHSGSTPWECSWTRTPELHLRCLEVRPATRLGREAMREPGLEQAGTAATGRTAAGRAG